MRTSFFVSLAVAVASVAALGAIAFSGGPIAGPLELFAAAALAVIGWASGTVAAVLSIAL